MTQLSARLFAFLFLLLTHLLFTADGREPNLTLMVPMRDGVELPTDIYTPIDFKEGASPCILIRSPSGRKAHTALSFLDLTTKGYTVAIQDTRSAIDKEGKTMPYLSDGWGVLQDGYDTVEWLAKHPCSNGKIGTVGVSALGITQLLLAPTAPPALKCQFIAMAAGDLYKEALFPGGQLCRHQVEGWLKLYAKDPSVFKQVLMHAKNHQFWEQFNTEKMAHRVSVPGLHIGGWFDIFAQGTINAFQNRNLYGKEGAKDKQKLVMGPWVHSWPFKAECGDFILPPQALQLPFNLSPELWFGHYLKGEGNSIQQLPTVTYYVMGPFDGSPSKGHRWKWSNEWPVASEAMPLYLSANQQLTIQPNNSSAPLSFNYDPENPVPTIGGKNLFLHSGPKDQTPLEKRDDVLIFTSDPLQEDLEVTGQVVASIFFDSDVPNSDIVIRLTDVYPDGKSILILDGIGNANGIPKTEGKPKEMKVDLWSTSMVFAKGHRIRVSLSGSNYPRFEKNPNKTTTKIYISNQAPSHILLPIIK